MPIAENRRSILNDSPDALIAKSTVVPTIINEKYCRMCIGSCKAAKSNMKGTCQNAKRIIEIMIHIKPNFY